MDHTNCRQLLESLSEYIDGVLEENLCSELERHLAGCENCRIVVDTLRKTVSLYQVNAEPAILPEEVRSRLYRCLELSEYLDDRQEGT